MGPVVGASSGQACWVFTRVLFLVRACLRSSRGLGCAVTFWSGSLARSFYIVRWLASAPASASGLALTKCSIPITIASYNINGVAHGALGSVLAQARKAR
eukprot:scaffold125107_cov17-Tisochrysis_lutea.AAC.1